MNLRVIFAGLVFAIAAACAQPSAPVQDQQAASGPVKPPVIGTEAACKTYGGDWRPICMMQKPACVVTFKDAGKSCSDSSECSGRCQTSGSAPPESAVRGVCTATSDPCGCFQLVEKGKAGYPLCAD
jgi:hypothetical protein